MLVFNWCYHGTVDETFATLAGGRVVERATGTSAHRCRSTMTTRVVEFNDVDALERELRHGDVALRPHRARADEHRDRPPRAGLPRRVARAHARAAGRCSIDRRDAHHLRGARRLHDGVRARAGHADVGKAIGSGIPSAAYGFTAEIAARVESAITRDESDVGGVGGTLAANVLSLAAVRATLEHVLTEEAFGRMIGLGERFEQGVQQAIDASSLPWHVTRLGCRAEYLSARAAGHRKRRGGRRRRATRPARSTSTRSTAACC